MTAWSTIETAPRDGTAVLLYYTSDGIVYGTYDPATADWWSINVSNDEFISRYAESCEEPTHWMPLPNPPNMSNIIAFRRS